ncbi:exonuclease domain-containing protein [Flavobacterium oreochromis]|uniref:DNA polymerase III subunit epsilon n=2 Tax=Flavobacterium TaxID=237 RepID=A0A246G7W3_9FLAO|nr:exonuclease domain-containing protein [Flavobacterium oreochromis]OWP74060.1 DNA polymerase III subunit epsilon [Flavobacterium oreochromis]OWP74720.1 DNA polymerase III subunit epsilon [Flavobacterium oreochromis]POR19556.1 DNA polymerase III subunit epsilon [Flavobacterium columnare]
MLDWLKHLGKEYPDFWKNYLIQLETPSVRKVALHIETSGLNPSKDKIISIGAIAIENNQILVEQSLEIELEKERILNAKELTYEEAQAIEAFIHFIGNATLIGHRIHYDIDILNEYLSKLHSGRIKNNLLDIEVMETRILDSNSKAFSLEELFSNYKIKNPEIVTSGSLAFNIGLLFLKMRGKLKIN